MLSGTRLGVYELIEPLGAGGMGEVFRAKDTKLRRDVALKLLPPAVALDRERLARFTREAQVLAALNHPNIAAIHGLEESGPAPALVLELVEGPTLADRIARGPIVLEEAIAIARQIAEALEYAHEHGIVHRDLKPANIKLRSDGTVKVLDFGLAKALTTFAATQLGQDLAQSPTLTSPATMPGNILGTPAYLSPEQARGEAIDRRVDIWAFGTVLFEMLTATRPIGAKTKTLVDTMAAILHDQPSWSVLPDTTPPRVLHLLRRTLEKDPRRRLRDIGEARVELEDIQIGGKDTATDESPRSDAPRSLIVRATPWTIAALALAAAGLWGWRGRTIVPEPATLKYAIAVPNLQLERTTLPLISPDGMRVVYSRDGQLWIRELSQLEPRALSGTNGAQFPFWSPDSRQLAYLTSSALWRIPIDGGQPIRIASYHFGKGARTPGGIWRRDGTIVFSPAATGTAMQVVSADGGEFHELFARDAKREADFHKPALLPDGLSFLYIIDRQEAGADTIAVMTGTERKAVLQLKGETLDSPVYSPTGHLLYQRDTTTPGIWAVPFSIEQLKTTGDPFLVDPQGAWPSVGANGVLLYAESEITGLEDLAWLDLNAGTVTTALNAQFPSISNPRLSPDGTRVAAIMRSVEGGSMVIVADLQRHTYRQISERARAASPPAWRDSKSVVYAVETGHSYGGMLFMRLADASQPATELFAGIDPSLNRTTDMIFVRLAEGMGGDLWHARVLPGNATPTEPTLFQQLPVHEWEPAVSPDGKWVAYTQGAAGQSEVILRGFPATSGQWQVSVAGGSLPVWSPAGDKLYFRDVPGPGQLFVVDVKTTPEVSLSTPRPVPRPSSLLSRPGFDISPDGSRLLMVRTVKRESGETPSLTVVQNWFGPFRKDHSAR